MSFTRLTSYTVSFLLILTLNVDSYGQKKTKEEAAKWIENKLSLFGYGNRVKEFKFEIDGRCQISYRWDHTNKKTGTMYSFFPENVEDIAFSDVEQEDQRDLTSVKILMKDKTANSAMYYGDISDNKSVRKIRINFELESKRENIPSRTKKALSFIVEECGGKIEEESF